MAQKDRAYFSVEPELGVRDGARHRTAIRVRLWGIHDRGACALPGCPKSQEIAGHLTAIAAYGAAGLPHTCFELEPPPMALYDSRVAPGSDEVTVAVRIAAHRPDETNRESEFLRQLCKRLRELGLPQR